MWRRTQPASSSRRDEAVFAAALQGALPRLRRYAIAMTGNAPLADDLVQDCLERAWRAREQLEQPDVPFAWLRTILHNAHIDTVRRRRHETGQASIDSIADDIEVSVSPDPTVATDMLRALQDVSVDHRRILVLAGIEGLSYQEIADELDIPLGTVMSRLARARRAVRLLLEPEPQPRAPNPDATKVLR